MSSSPPLALEGLRVLDVATILAGPVMTTMLGDFGAEVIKVEMPGRGDTTRQNPALGPGLSFIWLQEGRNKKSVTLDLHHPEGQDLLKRLVAVSDAMVENFRPGTLEAWGLGPEVLLGVNPRLVLLRLSGYGQTGPYRRKGAFDRNASAFGGGTYVTGYPEQPPVRSGYAVADYMAAYTGAFAVMTALYWRDARGPSTGSGRGQVIDLALYEPILRASEASIPIYDRTRRVRERAGNTNPGVVPAANFLTADGQWIAINANTDRLWRRWARVMERDDLLTDERFATLPARTANADALYAIIDEWARTKTAAELMATLDAAQVPADVIASVADLFADPHIQARANIVRVPDERVGALAVPGVIPKMSATPGRIAHLGPDLGSSNEAIYSGLLGLTARELAALKDRGVI
ncbi:MAG: CoA transferase [Chloroflexi bacterium]|nr:CoA transferase [Chloroflexota bacterium]